MMNILFIVDDLRSATGQCIINVVSECKRHNHFVSILTNNHFNYEGCNAYYLTDAKPSNRNIVKLKILLNLFRWPVKNPRLVKRFYNTADEIIKKEKTDVVICVFNSIETLLTGIELKKQFPNVAFVAYFLDAFYGGAVLSFLPKAFCDRKAINWQKKIFAAFDAMIFMRSTQKLYQSSAVFKRYFEKLIFLDIPMIYIPSDNNCELQERVLPSKQTNFVYVGSLPNNVRNPEHAIEVFSRLQQFDYHLYFFGSNDYKNIEKKCLNFKNIHFNGVVNHDIAIKVLKEADFLINIGNNISTMVPSKIFEYMSYKKPIISFYTISEDASLVYLSAYNNALMINEKSEIDKTIVMLQKFIEDHAKATDSYYLDDYLFLNTPNAFVMKIEEIYERHIKNK